MKDKFRQNYAQLNDHQKRLIKDIKDQAAELDDLLNTIEKMYDIRGARLAITKLEECVMWAIKAATWNPTNG